MPQLLSVTQVLSLIGKLDDSPGRDSGRERFRSHLECEVASVGQVRDWVEECLRNTEDKYNRALQDLINRLGSLLGFEVTYGRYRGTTNAIGFDGLWESPQGVSIVVEVKTTEAFSVKTATLVNYINELVSEGRIRSSDEAIGLYVIGERDRSSSQLENSIKAEKKIDQLRIISTEHLLSLAELIDDNQMGHDAALTLLQPLGPNLDPLVDLITDLVAISSEEDISGGPAQRTPFKRTIPPKGKTETKTEEAPQDKIADYYIAPAQGDDERSAEEWICDLVEEGVWAFGESTPYRQHTTEGDWICFYASGIGVIAHGRVKSPPCRHEEASQKARELTTFPYPLELDNVELYPNSPIAITAEVRDQLDKFEGRDPSRSWGWFVQTVRQITQSDFRVLTGQ